MTTTTTLEVDNTIIIKKYMSVLKSEINPSVYYQRDIIRTLHLLSKFTNQLSFKIMQRKDILAFLDNLRKPDKTDLLHKWIGTYNTYRIHLIRFFKWLYSPDLDPQKRPKPKVVDGIPKLKRKEKSIYRPTDLWNAQDDLLFLKYCPDPRIRCYHAMANDSAARPHELLNLKIKDVVFKIAPNEMKQQYAEILVNGKTGTRHIPLINSIPYLKDWLTNHHPQGSNSNSILLCGHGRSLGNVIKVSSLERIYQTLKNELFPKLLLNANIPEEDKQRIRELLKKPWNPYIRRHSALTEKSGILKEHHLRQYAGWTPRSLTHLKYLHYFGNEASESLLEAQGIITKNKKLTDALRPKQCPNCSESNKPDSKFCAKCKMILTYDAYNETIEGEKQTKEEFEKLKQQMQQQQNQILSMQTTQEELKLLLKNPRRLVEILDRESKAK